MLSMLLCHEQIWREILFKPLFLAFVIAKKKKEAFLGVFFFKVLQLEEIFPLSLIS